MLKLARQTLGLGLILCSGGCSDDGKTSPDPVAGAGGASGTTGVVSGAAGTGSPAGGGGNSGAGGASAGSAGSSNGAECALQGMFSASADMQLPDNTCGTLGSFKTTYNVVIDGQQVTMEQFVEMVPMIGTIDANCHIEIALESPTYREFDLDLSPTTSTASGTYVDANSSGCRSTYEATLTFTKK